MTAAELEALQIVDALAKIAYQGHGAFTVAWEMVPSAEQERWRAVVRAVLRATEHA